MKRVFVTMLLVLAYGFGLTASHAHAVKHIVVSDHEVTISGESYEEQVFVNGGYAGIAEQQKLGRGGCDAVYQRISHIGQVIGIRIPDMPQQSQTQNHSPLTCPDKVLGKGTIEGIYTGAGSSSKCNTLVFLVSAIQEACIGGFEPQAFSWPPVQSAHCLDNLVLCNFPEAHSLGKILAQKAI